MFKYHEKSPHSIIFFKVLIIDLLIELGMCFGLSIVTEMTLTLIRECMKEISDEVLADANDHQQLVINE